VSIEFVCFFIFFNEVTIGKEKKMKEETTTKPNQSPKNGLAWLILDYDTI